MKNTDKRVDEYIENAQDFAQPILRHLRQLVHTAYPDIQETIKWGMPYFEYKGLVCGLASFKQHVAFGFMKESLMSDPHKLFKNEGEAMGSLGKIMSMDDLPEDKILITYIKEAVRLNEQGVKKERPKTTLKSIKTSEDLLKALKKNKKAFVTFENFSSYNKKEYIEWIEEGKTDETRNRRIETAIEWMSEGKVRNWKYMK